MNPETPKPTRYSRAQLAGAAATLRTIPQIGDLTEDQLEAVDLAADFLTETVAVLDDQAARRKRTQAQGNRKARRRQAARDRRKT